MRTCRDKVQHGDEDSPFWTNGASTEDTGTRSDALIPAICHLSHLPLPPPSAGRSCTTNRALELIQDAFSNKIHGHDARMSTVATIPTPASPEKRDKVRKRADSIGEEEGEGVLPPSKKPRMGDEPTPASSEGPSTSASTSTSSSSTAHGDVSSQASVGPTLVYRDAFCYSYTALVSHASVLERPFAGAPA